MNDDERKAIVTAMAAHERAREAWQARGRTTWESTVEVGVSLRDIQAAADDRRTTLEWD